jgi:hypothetical protein
MASNQVFCFACGADPREYVPSPVWRISSTVLIVLVATWLLVIAVILVPRIRGRPWHMPFAGMTAGRRAPGLTSDGQGEPNRIVVTPELRHLIQDYERNVDFWQGRVGRLRELVTGTQGGPDSSVATLDWAETQLSATRQMVGALAVSSDSEAMLDVESFLDQRLAKVRVRLEEFEPVPTQDTRPRRTQ